MDGPRWSRKKNLATSNRAPSIVETISRLPREYEENAEDEMVYKNNHRVRAASRYLLARPPIGRLGDEPFISTITAGSCPWLALLASVNDQCLNCILLNAVPATCRSHHCPTLPLRTPLSVMKPVASRKRVVRQKPSRSGCRTCRYL